MKIRISSTILVILLLASTVPGVFAVQDSGTASDSGLISEAPLNPAYVEYKINGQSPDADNQINSKEKLGYIPEPADSSHLKGKKSRKKPWKLRCWESLIYLQGIPEKSFLHLPRMTCEPPEE